MKTGIEEELRELLERNASQFDMDRTLDARVVRKARRRAFRVITGIVAAVVALTAVSLFSLRSDQSTTTSRAPVLKLVDYAPADSEDSPNDPSFESAFQQHVQCMRDEGFDVPDPVKTEHGWAIIMSPGSDPLSDPTWREAALVTCSIEKFEQRPLTGDLVMGFSEAKINEFVACMRTQGYDLPEPTVGEDGQYRWSLQGLGIDTRTDEWNRAVFLACSPTGN
jgi:hypothetical protein